MRIKSSVKGTALIVALFMVTLAASVIALLIQLSCDTMSIVSDDFVNTSLYQVAQGAVLWGKISLEKDYQKARENQARLPLPWQFTQTIKAPMSATIEATIQDAEAKLNLNALTNPAIKQAIQQLFLVQGAGIPMSTVNLFLNQIEQQLQMNNPQVSRGALAHPLLSLRVLETKLSPEVFGLISPYLTVLPANDTLININTASERVLRALLTFKAAQHILLIRQQQLFSNDANMRAMLQSSVSYEDLNALTTTSHYFQESIVVKNKETTFQEKILWYVDFAGPKASIVWAQFGETP